MPSTWNVLTDGWRLEETVVLRESPDELTGSEHETDSYGTVYTVAGKRASRLHPTGRLPLPLHLVPDPHLTKTDRSLQFKRPTLRPPPPTQTTTRLWLEQPIQSIGASMPCHSVPITTFSCPHRLRYCIIRLATVAPHMFYCTRMNRVIRTPGAAASCQPPTRLRLLRHRRSPD